MVQDAMEIALLSTITGGYNSPNTARAWARLTAVAVSYSYDHIYEIIWI